MKDKSSRRRVTFQLNDTGAGQVFLAGSFNAWDPSVRPLKRNAEGLWKTTITLESGVYQYRFIVDGQWKEDPSLPHSRIDGSTAFNSVIIV